MNNIVMANYIVCFRFALTTLVSATVLAPAYALNKDPSGFLSRFHPKVSTAMVVTGPEHVERVLQHSLVFSPTQARKVLPALDRVLTKRHGWTRYASTPGAYVVYKRRGTHVSYMSAQVYRHLNWPDGTKLLPTKKGGCVVEYFTLKK